MSYPVFYPVAGDLLPIFFDTFDGGTGASITMTGLAVTDIEIYKDGSATTRASDNGYVLLDTDGIDFDSKTGIHGISINLGDNSDSGFFAVGSWYTVVISTVTVDGQTVSFVAASFRILSATRGMAGTALPDAAADAALGLPISDGGGLDLDNLETLLLDLPTVSEFDARTIASAAYFDPAADTVVNVTNVATLTGHTVQTGDSFARIGAPVGASISADIADVPTVSEFNARTLVAASYFDPAADDVDVRSIQASVITATSIATAAITNAKINTDAIGATQIAANAIGSSEFAGTAVQEIVDGLLDELTASHVGAGSVGLTLDNLPNDGALSDLATIEASTTAGGAGPWTTGAGGTGLTALAEGTARAGGSSTQILLATAETFGNDELNGNVVNIIAGTGAGQSRVIIDHDSATDTSTVIPAWITNPDATSVYEIVQGSANIAAIELADPDLPTVTEFEARTIVAANYFDPAADTVVNVTNVATLTGHTVQTGDNFARIGAPVGASISADIADIPTVSEFNARTIVAANYFDPAADTVVNVTNVATLTGHTVQTGDSFARIGAPVGASISADIADVPTVSEFNARTIVAANYFDPAADDVDVRAIQANVITNASIAVNAIGSPELAPNCIGSSQIANDAITSNKLVLGLITAAKFTNNAITSAVLATDSIGSDQLADSAAQKIRDEILPTQNVAFDNIMFLLVAASDHVTPVTGATGLAGTRSIDGGAFAGVGGSIAEVGNGIYQFDASQADMNGGKITFRFTASGGTPGAADDRFITIVTGGGV